MVLFQQSRNGRNIVFSITCLLIGVTLLVGKSLFAQTLPLGNQQQLGQVGELGTANDFHNDLQLGLQNLATNPAAQSLEQEIKNQDYKSTWDEFGINVLVDGASSPAEISKEIVQDIVQTVQIEESYDRQEMAYLETAKITPEEIQTAEGSTNSDLSPGASFNPNPSVDVNPDVSVSSVEGLEQGVVEISNPPKEGEVGSTTEATPINESIGETATTSEKANEFGNMNVATSTNESVLEAATTTENQIFEAILHGEQSTPPAEEPPTSTEVVPPPAESPPPQ